MNAWFKSCVILTLCLMSTFEAQHSFAQAVKFKSGWVERIMLPAEHISMIAKLDTGASISSLNAENIHLVYRAKRQWIDFDIYSSKHVLKHVSYPLIKYISIKSREDENHAGCHLKRPLIRIQVCIGTQNQLISVNLVNRGKFRYAFLLGRDDLAHFNLLIDPSKKYLLPLVC